MKRILFLPFSSPKESWTGDMATMLARQVPRHGTVLLGKAEGLEARFAILGGGKTGSPGVPLRLASPAEVARVVRDAVSGELVVDGLVKLGYFHVRLIDVASGELLWERTYSWKLPTLQRAIRGIAGGILEKVGRSRGDLAPWVARSPQAFYRFLRAEDMALQLRYGGGERLATRAFSAYRGAVKQDPGFAPAVEGLVRLASSVGAGEALSAFRDVASLVSEPTGAAWLAKGFDLLGAGSEALPLWRICNTADRLHPWAARALGDDLLRQGNENEALKVWQEAGVSPRADASLLGRLATLLRRRGLLAEAEAVFSRLPECENVTPDLWHAYGALLEERHGARLGADLFSKALSPDVKAETWMDLGLMLVRGERLTEAEKLGTELSQDPDPEAARMGSFLVAAARNPKVWRLLRQGTMLLEAGQARAARRHLRVVVKTWPHLAEVRYLLGLCCLRLERHKEGVAALKSCLSLDDSFPEARSKLGIALVALGQFDDAYTQLLQALDASPRSVSVLTHLAQACYYLGNLKEGEVYVKRARKIAPDHPVVQQTATEFFSL